MDKCLGPELKKIRNSEAKIKEMIYEAALTLFAEKGFHAVSMRDISALAECNVSAINYHFGSKEELYKECLYQEDWHSLIYIVEQSVQNVSSYGEFCDKIRFIVFQAIDSIINHPRKSQLIVREISDFSSSVERSRLSEFNKATVLLTNFIKLAQKKEIIKISLDPHFAARFILTSSFFQGVTSLRENNIESKEKFIVQITEQLSLIIFKGVS